MSLSSITSPERRRRLFVGLSLFALVAMIAAGVFARNAWFPRTDNLTGDKYGWFGAKLPKNAGSTWNPLAGPSPTPTPQLLKEYIYAGSRMLAVVDANANETPPGDLAVWRPSSGTWYVFNLSTLNWTELAWGNSTDTPVQGDYDGDGKTDFAIYRPVTGQNSQWWITTSSNGSYYTINYGTSGDKPAVADYDGDGKTDIAVFTPSNGNWNILKSSTNSTYTLAYGTSTDEPTPADYDGDGKADISVWRSSNTRFYTVRSSDTTTQEIIFESAGTPVSGDYDGDGKANYAIRNGASWIIMNAAWTSAAPITPPGDAAGDIPVQNDYDGDGKVDIAVWRNSNGNWYIRKSGSSNALRQEAWGTTNDIPVPALWRR